MPVFPATQFVSDRLLFAFGGDEKTAKTSGGHPKGRDGTGIAGNASG
jgi:hypothetical protein